MRSQQVQRRQQEDPDDIDKVPVEPQHVDGRVVLGGEMSAMGEHGDRQDSANSNDHVQGMKASHDPVQEQKQLHRPELFGSQPLVEPFLLIELPSGDQVFFVIDVVLQPLERQKSEAEQRREKQK